MTIFQQAKDDMFIKAIREAVAERGEDFEYPMSTEGWAEQGWDGDLATGCLYVRTDVDEPACLIGAALHKTGMGLDHLRRLENSSARMIMEGTGYSTRVSRAADKAQGSQDLGDSWGEALGMFEDYLSND